MKQCGKCGETKPLEAYNFRDKAHKKMRGICKKCENIHKARWYEKNRKKHIKNVGERRKKNKEEIHAFLINYFKSNPCTRCGESDYRVLEFHHVRGKKKQNVGTMIGVGYTLSAVKKEIAKCDVVCANCHRIITSKEQGWYRGGEGDS